MAAVQTISPERFGRYVLLDRIGEGGMAEVFRAIMPGAEGFKRTLVVKRILSSHSKSTSFVDMFVREARIGAMLSHPNIVQVYDFGSVEGHYFLAMEYLRGRDVLAIIKRLRDMKKPFPVPVAAFIAHEVAACLGYAHELMGPDGRCLDIVHRDVSPSNVMCLREGGVKLLDFGIAKAVNECAPENTEQGIFKGKLAYTSPERMRSEHVDGRADLYSLGVVLWEMLTCRRLFRGATDVDTFKNIQEMKVPPPSSRRDDIPPALDAIVLRAVEKDPDKRYQSGRAMAEDLEEVLRETGFKVRMLPQMLNDLFGAGLQSSQVVLSQLTPELLAASAASEEGTGNGLGAVLTGSAFGKRWWGSWRVWAVVGAVASMSATYAITRHGRSDRAGDAGTAISKPTSKAAAPVSPEARVQAPLERAPAPSLAPAAPAVVRAADEESSEARSDESAKRSKKAAPARRATSGGSTKGTIGSGLSIDPFKEAASRGIR